MAEKDGSLEMINKEAVDLIDNRMGIFDSPCLENIPMEEVFENLRCTCAGLTSNEVDEQLQIFGFNKLEEKKESKLLKFLGFMWNPLSWVMEAAAIMAIALANGGICLEFIIAHFCHRNFMCVFALNLEILLMFCGFYCMVGLQGKLPDWQDFVGIITLLVINSTISFIEENNVGNAAATLMAGLAPKAKVLRDGRWSEEDAACLVPGHKLASNLEILFLQMLDCLKETLSRLTSLH